MFQHVAKQQAGDTWAAFLRDAFDQHPAIQRPADLVRASGLKPNGRPRIDASRVTSWLRGQQPSFEMAGLVAEAFGIPRRRALEAAGYTGTETVSTSSHPLADDEVPVGAGADPEAVALLATADPDAVRAVITLLKAAQRGE